MKIKEITAKNTGDLNKLLAEKREALRTFRFGVVGTKIRNVKEGRGLRRDIARILTTLNKSAKN